MNHATGRENISHRTDGIEQHWKAYQAKYHKLKFAKLANSNQYRVQSEFILIYFQGGLNTVVILIVMIATGTNGHYDDIQSITPVWRFTN